ncbi:hypothetical protein [Roseibium album]|uniref:hypothetical protein n=1 Tax=Roseibium album TaxID=311410 RepID=UPI0039195573
MRDHLPGVYIYGALTIIMLFIGSIIAMDGVGLFLVIACSGCSYFASLAGYAGRNIVCNFFMVGAVLMGIIALISIIT